MISRSSIRYGILFVLTFIITINTVTLNSYEDRDTTIEKTNLKIDDSKKIDSIIQQWQSSTDPVAFAQEKNLTYSNEKIRVYIYLDTPESISNLTQIEVTSSADNIVVAYLDSRQITQAAQLDFVQRIGPPILARPAPIPIDVSDDNDKSVLLQYSHYAIIIAAAMIIAGIIYLVKRKNQKTIGQKL